MAGHDPDVIGKPLRLSDETVRVVGTMPPEFTHSSRDVGLWRVGLGRHLAGNPSVFINARQRELAVMQALGATSSRVWRSILIEMSVLGVLGATIAVGLLYVGLDSFKTLPAWRAARIAPVEALHYE